MPDIGERRKKDMKRKIIYTDAPQEISEAIERNSVMADFLPRPEMLVRKEKARKQPAFSRSFRTVSV